MGLVINHIYQFRDKVGYSGDKFSHSDSETEHILNLLCGKESFTQKEKLYFYKHVSLKICKNYAISVPRDIDTWEVSDYKSFNPRKFPERQLVGCSEFLYQHINAV